MHRSSVIVVIIAVLTLACSCLAIPTSRPAAMIPSQEPTFPVRTPAPTPTWPQSTPDAGRGFTIVVLQPSGGDLNEQLAAEVARAHELGQDPYVEFGATWCPACQAIESSLNEENDLMVDAFQGVYVVRVDVDEWADALDGTGFDFDAIPIFFGLNDQGRPTEAVIDGNAWGANIPVNMAPPLKAFFQSN